MRVIHVLQGLHAAGIEHLALQLIAHRPAGVHCTLLNLDRSVQQLRSAFETQRASAHLEDIVDCPAADGFLLFWRCWRVFRCQQPDAVLLYPFSRPMLWVALAARLAGVRRLRVHVGNAAPRQRDQRMRWLQLLRWFGRLGVVALPCSEAVARSFEPLPSGLRLGPVVINGCDCREINRRAAQARLSTTSTPNIVLMVARLDAIKDQSTLVRAFAKAMPLGWQLHLVGDGPRRSELETLIAALDLEAQVHCLGCRSDVPELLGRADLFAFSTTAAEGFGIALVEAMAAGLPVMASDVSACREVLAGGAAGVLLPAADVGAWAQALQRLTADHQARQRLSLAARHHADRFGIQACADRWYAELIA